MRFVSSMAQTPFSKAIRGYMLTTGILTSVSQFTLLASMKKGNKPSFHQSAAPNTARELYTQFFKKVQSLYKPERVKDGVFQAMMDVALVNDGPVGLDYCCEDGVVKLPARFSHSLSGET